VIIGDNGVVQVVPLRLQRHAPELRRVVEQRQRQDAPQLQLKLGNKKTLPKKMKMHVAKWYERQQNFVKWILKSLFNLYYQGFDNIAWELGNEPNSLKRHFDKDLDGFQLGNEAIRANVVFVAMTMLWLILKVWHYWTHVADV
jgi:hypothetical protein